MGGCYSDVSGGTAAVRGPMPMGVGGDGHNDAVDYFYKLKGYQPLFTQIELCLSARKVFDHSSFFSERYLMAVLFITSKEGELEEVDRTEEVMNDSDLDLSWSKKICVCYRFGALQELTVRVYDVHSRFHTVPTKELQLHELGLVAEFRCHLSKIVCGTEKTCTLKPYKNHCDQPIDTLSIRGEETAASRGTYVEILFRSVLDIESHRWFSEKKRVLKISKVLGGRLFPICMIEVKTNKNPTWSVSLSMLQICSKDDLLFIQGFNINSNGIYTLFGEFKASLSELERLHREKVAAKFVKPHDLGPGKVIEHQLFVDEFCEKQSQGLYSFLDYLSGGFELSLMVAVDFTASNGDPKRLESKHYIDPSGNLNLYQQVLKKVGDAIKFYDSSRHIPAWGFGGKTMDGEDSVCFNLNRKQDDYTAEKVEGILAAYKSAVQSVILDAPAKLSEVIDKASEVVSDSLTRMPNKYNILLILTDGDLFDVQQTTNSLVKASALPLSILIVGVGDDDFKEMKNLTRNNGHRLESCERLAARNIVTFLSIGEVRGSGEKSMVETLFENVPEQFITFMQMRGIKPRHVNVASN